MTIARKTPLLMPNSAERFAVYEPTTDEVEIALASSVASALPSASLGLGIMYSLLSISHWLLLPLDQRSVLLPIAAVSAAFFLLFYFTGMSNQLERHGHAMAGVFGIIALLNSAVHLWISADPLQSSNILLVMLAVSAFFLSTRWFVIVTALSVGSWVAAALSNTLNDTWVHFGIALAMALLTTIIIHRVRVRAYINLHKLRLQNDRQLEQLDEARKLLQTRVKEQSQELVTVSGSLSKERLRGEIRESVLQEQAADLARKTQQLEQKFASQIDALKRENGALATTVKMRTETVSTLADKMHLPLITAQSSLEALNRTLDKKLTLRQEDLLQRAANSLNEVRDSADKLRSIPRMTADSKAIVTASVQQLVEAASNNITPKAKQKQVQTQFAIDGGIQTVQMEANQLRLALVAMLNTTLERMLPNETIGLTVRGNAENKQAHFIVWSTGRAFLPLEHKNMFASRDTSAKYDLLLAKRLVEKADGTVALHNGQGNGLLFTISLPWEPTLEERRSATTASSVQHPVVVEALLRNYHL